MIAANDPNRGWSLGTNDHAGKMPQEVYRLHRQGRSTPCTSVMRTTSVASEANLKPGNRKGTNPGPPNCSGRTRRIVLVLKTPPRVLSSTAANCGPPFGTKRPQVQILSPRPVPQVADLRECCALRAASHLPAIATEASREQKGTRGNPRESRGRLRRAEEHPASPHDVADPPAQQGPSGHVILRPQQRGLSGGTSAGQESPPIRSRQARQARDPRRAPPGGGSGRPERPQLHQLSAFR